MRWNVEGGSVKIEASCRFDRDDQLKALSEVGCLSVDVRFDRGKRLLRFSLDAPLEGFDSEELLFRYFSMKALGARIKNVMGESVQNQ